MKKIKYVFAALLVVVLVMLMGTDIEKLWVGSPDVVYQTHGYGGTDAFLALANESYIYTSAIDLRSQGYEGTQIAFSYDCNGTTDNLVFSVFASQDGSDFDDIEYWSVALDNNGGADTQVTFVIRDLGQFRIGIKSPGTTALNDYNLQILSDPWNWEN